MVTTLILPLSLPAGRGLVQPNSSSDDVRPRAPDASRHAITMPVASQSRRVPSPTEPQPDSAGSQAAAMPEPAPASSPDARPGELNLTLSPGSLAALRSANPALADDRIRSVRKGLAERFGEALKPGDEMTIQALGQGRIRVRKGSICYEMVESRNAQLNPFSDFAAMHEVNCGN